MNNPYFECLNSIKRDEIPEPEVEYIVVESLKSTNEILTPKKEERNSRGEVVVLIY